MQELCVRAGLADLSVLIVQHIVDYEMHVNLYQAIVNVAMSENEKVQKMVMDHGCVKEISKAAVASEFHKVRRICSAAAEKLPLSDKVIRKK